MLTISLFNGLVYGSLLIIMSSGLALIYGLRRVVNFAHGALYMLGAYIGYTIAVHTSFWLALFVAPAIMGLIGVHNRLPTDTEGQAYNAAMVLFQGVDMADSVKPADVTKALRGAEVESLYGKVKIREQDNQMLIPNYIARVKMADGKLRPVIEESYPASITPPASPQCKM